MEAQVPVLTNEGVVKLLVYSKGTHLSAEKLDQIIETIRCESGFVAQQSKVVNKGVREDSWGIAQIHLPSHPKVSREQAMDIDFATQFIVDKFTEGKEEWWSCWKTLYKRT